MFDPVGRYRHAFTTWPNEGVVPLPACGTGFIPAGPLAIGAAASLVANNVQSTFSVGGNELRCLGSGSATAFALLQGVEDFQVWYGLRIGDNLLYRTATAISVVVPVPWDQVETVQVCLRLAGELSNNPGAAVTGCNGENIANDGRIRRVFFRVFKIRNQGL